MSKIVQRTLPLVVAVLLAAPATAQLNRYAKTLGAAMPEAEWPEAVMCGESFTVDVTMTNPHAAPWTEADFHKLGPLMGEKEPFRPDGLRVKMPDGTTVPYGGKHTFTLELTAPEEEGIYETQWSMMAKGEPFGVPIKKSIRVHCDDAALGRALFPDEVACGEVFTVEVRMLNKGRSEWTEAKFYKLGPVLGEREVFRPDGQKFKMPDGTLVPAGDKFAFELELTAPDRSGTYETKWVMMKGGTPFGEEISRTIEVKCKP